jgi:hypothetical protein
MNGFRLVPPARLVLVLGSLAGLLAGMTTVALAGATLAGHGSEVSQRSLEAIHLPPLLTLEGESVTLEYEAFCLDGSGEPAEECDVQGTVFVRTADREPFTSLPLEVVSSAEGRRLIARVPEAVVATEAGFEYYAELRSSGLVSTLPAGGAAAPHRSIRLGGAVEVDLGTHTFGHTRRADARVASADWGSGRSDVGLEEGRNLSPIGTSAFDVDRTGTVYLLDEARHRILRWRKGAPSPTSVSVAVSGSLADMAVAPDGSIYVLETVGRPGGTPVVRRFDGDGRELERAAIAERAASQIRSGPDGPVVLQQPSHQWMPVTEDGTIAGARSQRARGTVGRPLAGGGDIVVLRTGDGMRVAWTGPDGERRSWVVRSATTLGEIQLAQPLGGRLVVVARAYTDDAAEFVVLILDDRGLARTFSVTAAEWAEAAPLGRFELVGSSLYRLGSTPKGAFVDRYDLEVRR